MGRRKVGMGIKTRIKAGREGGRGEGKKERRKRRECWCKKLHLGVGKLFNQQVLIGKSMRI